MKKYDIAAYIWPAFTGAERRTKIFWPDGIGEWQTVKMKHHKPEHNYVWDREPLWGYLDEADPAVMEKHIKEATDHGVNVFIYDWYWFDNRPFLENCLCDGFLKAPNSSDMKFYIMWANHDVNNTWDYRLSGTDEDVNIWQGAVSESEFKKIGKRWIEKLFTCENYYKIDNKPVVSIYDLKNLIVGLGGIEKTRENLDYVKNEAKKAGFDGVHFQLIKWSDNNHLNISGVDGDIIKVTPELVTALGFDSMTHYQMVHYTDINRDYTEILPDMVKEWNKIKENFDIPFYPHVSVGWDNNPRFKKFIPFITKNNTPENFKKALEEAKAFSDKHCEVPLITINSWNEWTETSYLIPDNINGYGYLDAIKDTFTS